MQNAMPVLIIKIALSELHCLQALHLPHVYSVLCSAALKIPSLILNGFLPLTPEAGRYGCGSHPASTTCMLTSSAGACLYHAALLSVSLGIFFFFVIEMLVTNFLECLCLITDHSLFSWVSFSFCLPAFPPHPSDEGWGQPLHREMIRRYELPKDTIFSFPK